MKTESTYIERAEVMNSKAGLVEVSTINNALDEFENICKKMADNTVEAANKSREIGLHLQAFCGHEQMELWFWNEKAKGKIKCTYQQAKVHLATARKLKLPAKTAQEAAPFIQAVLFAGEYVQLPERTETQNRANISMVQRFFAEFTLMRQPFKKIVAQQPMEQWDAPALDEFLLETEWLATERDRAAKLRAAK